MITEHDRTFASYQNRPNITKEIMNKIYQKLKGAKIVEMYIGYLEVYRRLKAEGTKLVFDIGWDDEMSLDKYREYLEIADYFTPNQKEALKITHSSNVREAANKLSEFFDTVIIKLDKDGCLVVQNGNHHIIPPLPNINAIDPTGQSLLAIAGIIVGCPSSSAHNNSSISYSIDKDSPHPPVTGYKPPKNCNKRKGKVPAPKGRGDKGWPDKKGNVWVPDWDMDGGEGWRRHYTNGKHDHVYPDGKVRTHKFTWDFDFQVLTSFSDQVSEVTGLTGGALIVYLFIFEGSRIIPQRNLIPVI